MRLLRNAAVIILLIGVAIGGAVYFTIIAPIDRKLGPATPENAFVDMLESQPNAVILTSFATGDVPRVLRGNALDVWSQSLWFTDNHDAGNLLGAVILGMGGMPPETAIGAAFIGGTPTVTFSCITVGCIKWPANDTRMWGLGALSGQGAALGPEVHLEQQTFTEYEAYLEAHANVVSDPLRWFAEQGTEIPQLDTDGLRLVVVTLPTRFVTPEQMTDVGDKNTAMATELTAFADTLIDGLNGKVQAIHGATVMPIWVTKDDRYIRDVDGGTRSLPDYAMHSPVLRLNVPPDAIPILRTRLTEASLPSADFSVIEPAVAAAFAAWNIDASCLPQCGGIIPTREFLDRAKINVAQPPFWALSAWRVPPPT